MVISTKEEKELIKKMYDGVYSSKARKIGRTIRNDCFGSSGNIGQNCILSKDDIDKAALACGLGRGQNVLDLCCGDGAVPFFLATKYNCNIYGIDFSETGIRVARKDCKERGLAGKCNFYVGLAEKLPFRDSYFDAIYSLDSFVHVYDKKALFDECFRVLKPGGKIFFFDWVDMDGMPKEIQRSGELWGYIYIAANSDYKELLEEAGFQILRVEDNSRQFTNIIAKWEGVNLSYKNMLIKECGLDYFNTAIKRWRLAREFSQAGVLGQNLFICRKAFSSSMMEKEQTKKILNLLSGFCGLWVINAGLESGLLGIIADYRSALSEKKMIAKSGLAPRYVKNWLYAAYSFEIIDYIPGKGFIYAPFAKEAIERLKNEICMYAKLSRVFASLPRAMSGKPRKPLLKQDFALVKAMSEVTKSDFPEITGQIIPKIPRLEMKLKKGAAMLDVGAGLGHGAIHFAKVFPKSIISGVEIDERAYKTALKNIKKEGLENRVSIKKVDANKMHFNKKFDFVFLNLTFHEISQDYERKILFLKKCRTMLKEGGVFLISELPFPAKIAECRAPAMKILSSLSICEAFFGGELASPSGYKEFLKKAGYKNIRQLKQGNPVRVFISATG